MDNLIGKKLDGLYEVRELIGSGGMANVYKAVMLGHNGPVPAGTVVAVKVLRQEYMHDPDLVRRFKNESKAISLLNHHINTKSSKTSNKADCQNSQYHNKYLYTYAHLLFGFLRRPSGRRRLKSCSILPILPVPIGK